MTENMKIRLHHILWQGLLPLFMLWGVVGCTDEAISPAPPATEEDGGDEPVMIRATVPGAVPSTRNGAAYNPGEPTPITGRTMLFTFPSIPDGEMKSLPCEFDDQGIGYIYYEDGNDQKKQLRWRDIYTQDENKAVYLDNLVKYPVQEGDFANSDVLKKYDNFTKMRFGPPENTNWPLIEGAKPVAEYWDPTHTYFLYKWMISPDDNSLYAQEVDIIWAQFPGIINGTSSGGGRLNGKLADHVGQSIHFELEHKMSTIIFRFYSTDEKDQTLELLLQKKEAIVYLDDMSVWLEHKNTIGEQTSGNETDDATRVIPFQRQNGQIYTGGTAAKQDGVLLTKTLTEEESSSTTSEKIYYSTPTWIVPPIKVFNVGYSPVLTIKLGDYTFSGSLPDKMQYWEQDENEQWKLSDPVNLAFKEGYRHTFNVRLTLDLGTPDLIFDLVEVAPWSPRFTENVTAGESGIYYWEDLKYVATLYNKNPEEDNYKLMRYGTWKEDSQEPAQGKWVFPLWDDIIVPADESARIFKDGNFEIERKGATEHQYTIKKSGTELQDGDLVKSDTDTPEIPTP